MCGINGIINFNLYLTSFNTKLKNTKKIIQEMNKSLIHRGPDGNGIYISKQEEVTLGHTRLSIVDLKRGIQPFVIRFKQYEYVITFNGEIYNYKDLKKELETKGYTFKTNCDTEVLLMSYIAWKENCLNKLVGEFAFVIYDQKRNVCFLARDRTGVKPLYYTLLPDQTYLVSSEPKGILKYPSLKKEPDVETIADFFLGMLTFAAGNPALNRSFFKNINSLNPGTYGIITKKGIILKQYWDIPLTDKKSKIKNFSPLLRKKLTKAVEFMIPGEVKCGTALSGGLDSSIITTLAAEKIKGLTSSCIKFKGTTNLDYSFAKMLAKAKKINLFTPNLTPQKMISDIEAMIYAMDEPHDSIRQLGMFANYRTLHNAGCKVVLTGEGADEFNLGYYHKFPGLKLDGDACNTSKNFRNLWRKRVKYTSNFFTLSFLEAIDFEKLIEFNVSNYYDQCKSKDPIKKMQYFYAKKFLKFLQDANDRCSMAHSVEARLPYCDRNFIKVALQVPKELNLKNDTEKYVLRKAFEDKLPKEIYTRRKAPLPANEDMRVHKLLARELDRNIKSASQEIWNIFNKNFILKLNKTFKERIIELEKIHGKGNGGQYLTAWLPISGEVEIRTNHIFSVLTFMRWYHINFN